ncbi:MAG: hypothetical protein WBM19_11560, partial [Azonexus sp.]
CFREARRRDTHRSGQPGVEQNAWGLKFRPVKAGYFDGFMPVCQSFCVVGKVAYRLPPYAI